MSKVLVIGSTGNVGSRLIHLLADKKINVAAATRNPDKFTAESDFISPVKFDIEDQSTYSAALDGTDKVFLISPPLRPDSRQISEPFIETMKNANISKVVYMSASGVNYSDDNPLRQVEIAIEKSGLSYSFIRPNFFMENFTAPAFGGLIKQMGGFFLNADDGKTAFLSADDIAASALKLLTEDGHDGKGYTLTSSESLDHTEVAKIMSEVTGKTITYTAIPDEAMLKGFMDSGMPEQSAHYMTELYKMVKQGLFAQTFDDMAELLGRKTVTFREFAEKNKEAWK
jgi:uncharacterized protein YbjT (DUF2867 family)